MAEPSKFLLQQVKALKRDPENLELAHDIGVQAVHEGYDTFGRDLLEVTSARVVRSLLRRLPWEGVRVTTNYQWRPFVYAFDVPTDVLADQFDYHDDEVFDGYFQYHGTWYHLDQFMCVPAGVFPAPWQGYLNDSMSTGVVIRVADDGETYQVGYFVS